MPKELIDECPWLPRGFYWVCSGSASRMILDRRSASVFMNAEKCSGETLNQLGTERRQTLLLLLPRTVN